jgi:tetratricopeptide (TPR) repeat protein
MKKSIYFIALLFFLGACTKAKRDAEFKSISDLRNKFYSALENDSFDFNKARELAEKCKAFTEAYPKEERTPSLLIDLGNMYVNFLGESEAGINSYLSIYKSNPDHDLAPEGIFFAASVYHDKLKKYKEARENYNLLIQKYPNHQLSKQAQILLKHIGKTPEELYQEIVVPKLQKDSTIN